MANVLRAYNRALLRRPMLTQCITGSVLLAIGDVMAQQIVEKKGSSHDYLRTARLTIYRGLLFGPPLSMWYNVLNAIKYTSPVRGLMTRVALDQVVFAPVATALFFGSMSIMEGKPEDAIDRIQDASLTTLIHGWAVYIPAQVLNFTLVPPHLRAVFVSGISVFWNMYLSTANASYQPARAAASAIGPVLI